MSVLYTVADEKLANIILINVAAAAQTGKVPEEINLSCETKYRKRGLSISASEVLSLDKIWILKCPQSKSTHPPSCLIEGLPRHNSRSGAKN